MIQRTPGVSTTDITGKLLNLAEKLSEEESKTENKRDEEEEPPTQKFLQTSHRISMFSNGKIPSAGDTNVYISASCDLLHPGVIERLRRARELGDFLYVGIWDDEMTRYYRGSSYPLQTVQERVLMALGCRYVDEVIIGAPYILTGDLLTSLNITKVVHVTSDDDNVLKKYQDIDPYEVAKERGIFTELQSQPDSLTINEIALRVRKN